MANIQIVANPALPSLSYEGGGRNICVASDGRIWTVYVRKTTTQLHVYASYSDDGGNTWNEEAVANTVAQHHFFPAIAIDSGDNPHVVYTSRGRAPFVTRYGIFYKNRVGGVWSAEETVALLNVANPGQEYPSIAIDSLDNVHVVWDGLGWGVNTGILNIEYGQRFAGVWDLTQQVTDANVQQDTPCIAIDSSNNVHVSWRGKGYGVNTGNYQLAYATGPGIWTVENVTDDPADLALGGRIALDSYDKPHIAYHTLLDGTIKYTNKISGSWLAPETVSLAGATLYGYSHISLDRTDKVFVVWSSYGDGLSATWANLWVNKRDGVWLGRKFITNQDTTDQIAASLAWSMWPLIGGVRTNILPGNQNVIWEASFEADWFGTTPAYLALARPMKTPTLDLVAGHYI